MWCAPGCGRCGVVGVRVGVRVGVGVGNRIGVRCGVHLGDGQGDRRGLVPVAALPENTSNMSAMVLGIKLWWELLVFARTRRALHPHAVVERDR